MFLNTANFQVILAFYLFLALKAGLEIEWASVEKPLRKAVKKYVQNGSSDCEGDRNTDNVQVAEDESVERYVLLGIHMTLIADGYELNSLNVAIHFPLDNTQDCIKLKDGFVLRITVGACRKAVFVCVICLLFFSFKRKTLMCSGSSNSINSDNAVNNN